MSAAVIDLAKFEVTYLPTRVTLAECAPSVTVSVPLVCEAAEVKLMTVPKTETPAKSMNWTWLAWATPPNPVIFPV